MHLAQITSERPFTRTASNGHTSSHVPHAMHAPSSTSATYPDDATIGTPCFTIASSPPQQHVQQLQMA